MCIGPTLVFLTHLLHLGNGRKYSFFLIRQMISSVQLVSHIRLCDPRTTTCHASLSITNSQSLLRLMSTKSVVASNHLILCRPLLLLPSLFPSIRVFSMSQFFASGGQIIGVSASASVLPKNIQD